MTAPHVRMAPSQPTLGPLPRLHTSNSTAVAATPNASARAILNQSTRRPARRR